MVKRTSSFSPLMVSKMKEKYRVSAQFVCFIVSLFCYSFCALSKRPVDYFVVSSMK